MTVPDSAGKPHTIVYQLRYITTDFEFGDKQISMSDPVKKIEVLLRKRTTDDAPLTALPLERGDGVVTITCTREVSQRLLSEAASAGQLSLKKEAVYSAYREMHNHMSRTIRLLRWRTKSDGRPNPIRSSIHDGFRWSLDGNEWKPVADYISMKLSIHVHPVWTSEAEQFLNAEAFGELDEPLGHELFREAWTNRDANPRSCVVLAVAAAEVGFKQFASKAFPDAAWILESLQAPPLVKMLAELFPWSKLKVQVNGKSLTPPESVMNILKKAVVLRNDIVHGRGESLSGKTVDSVLTAVRDLLYFLDVAQGREWAIYHLSAEARKHFPQITSWPLLLTQVVA
jgi:hypothetical protein